jgi:uncharacterized protein YycO
MSAANPQPGDFALCRIPGIAGRAIALGERLIGDASAVQHAYVYVGDGNIVQAMPSGAELVPLSEAEPAVVWSGSAINLTESQRDAICHIAKHFVGTPYGWLDYISLALAAWHIRPGFVKRRITQDDTLICSQLVDYAYECGGVWLFDDGRIPGDVTPGDLLRLLQQKGAKGA